MGKTKSISGADLDPDEPAFPCGLVAKSYFTDSYKLYYTEKDAQTPIIIDDSGIAWDSDKEFKFKNLENTAEMMAKQWIKVTDGKYLNIIEDVFTISL